MPEICSRCGEPTAPALRIDVVTLMLRFPAGIRARFKAGGSVAETKKFFADEREKWRGVIKSANVAVD